MTDTTNVCPAFGTFWPAHLFVEDRIVTIWVAPDASTWVKFTVTAWEITLVANVRICQCIVAPPAICITEGLAGHLVGERWRTVYAGEFVLVLTSETRDITRDAHKAV